MPSEESQMKSTKPRKCVICGEEINPRYRTSKSLTCKRQCARSYTRVRTYLDSRIRRRYEMLYLEKLEKLRTTRKSKRTATKANKRKRR